MHRPIPLCEYNAQNFVYTIFQSKIKGACYRQIILENCGNAQYIANVVLSICVGALVHEHTNVRKFCERTCTAQCALDIPAVLRKI